MRHEPPVDFNNPLLASQYRRPDWRFIIAQTLSNDHHEDPHIDRLVKCYYNGTWCDDPEMDAVVRIHQDYRVSMAALIIGGASNKIIASTIGTLPEVVQLYRIICFDVYPDDPVLKKEKVVIEYATSPKQREVLKYAFTHGWETFLRTCGKLGKDMANNSSPLSEESLKEVAIALAHQRLAEQEIAPISSKAYTNDSLLRSIVGASKLKEEKIVSSIEDDIKKLVQSINKEDSRNKMKKYDLSKLKNNE